MPAAARWRSAGSRAISMIRRAPPPDPRLAVLREYLKKP
jgi:hypothetical protein